MKLKLDDAGHAVLQDGKPVYVHDDGKEIAHDAAATVATITRLNGEAKASRIRAETAETSLKTFEGITDPTAALKAMNTVASLDQKKMIDAGEVDKLKADINGAWQTKYDAAEKRGNDLESTLNNHMIGGAFTGSPFVKDKIAIPPDLLRSHFGSAFRIEDGKVVAYQDGSKLTSRAKPGEPADFDEALEILVDGYPHRDHILKGNSNGGGGTRQSNGQGGSKTMSRAAYDALPLEAQRNAIVVDKVTLVD